MDEIVLEHFSSVLVVVPWLPTVIIYVEATAIGYLDLGFLYDILALNNFGKFHGIIALGVQSLDQLNIFFRELHTSYTGIVDAFENRSDEWQRIVRAALSSTACELLVHVTMVTSRLKPLRHED